jgi:hypothetical protein
MTLPGERTRAVENTRAFLEELLDAKKTPRVPAAVRRRALRCLRHYPWALHMKIVADKDASIFGDPD